MSMIIIPRILVVALKKRLFDLPDSRKVHKEAIPRLGGLSFAPSILFSLSFVSALYCAEYMHGQQIPLWLLTHTLSEFYLLVCGVILLYLAGLKDDLVGMRYTKKFMVQLVAALLLPLSGLWINNLYGLFGIHELASWIGIPLTILVIVFITNAINLIDGIDGLASGLTGSALLVLGSLFLINGMWIYALLSFATLGVLVPFFYYNVFGQADHGRKIFMGDTGSLTLGYILVFLAIRYSSYNQDVAHYSAGAIVVAFSTLIVPMFDVVRVMIVRARSHRSLFKPDRNHIHHKFLDMGMSAHKAMISIVVIASLFSSLNILLVSFVNINIVFAGDIVIWIILSIWFEKVGNKKEFLNGKEWVKRI
ncbi:undecaprenyl/decaprenyl-phosphate alpha-N-acetylglucosaminyl 1-phosphate transferase [Parabacteroides merdae]|nr:undecaprenyl/decaprenyl-phosphate alpha-N-acetylglucosaminyl 1-phosphate transferase [Parabacteroides merdae]